MAADDAQATPNSLLEQLDTLVQSSSAVRKAYDGIIARSLDDDGTNVQCNAAVTRLRQALETTGVPMNEAFHLAYAAANRLGLMDDTLSETLQR